MTEETTTAAETKPSEPKVSGEKTEKAATPQASGQSNDRRSRGKGGGRRNDRRQKAPKEFEEAVIAVDRVTRVTRGGRQLRFRVSVVIGNKKGKVGFGIGKSTEVMLGVQKAVAHAKKNMIDVSIFEDSIPHEIVGKFKATKVLLFPAQEGKGVIAGGAVRKIMELVGIKNVLSKMHGSSNAINAAYATINALEALQNRTPVKKSQKAPTDSEETTGEKTSEDKNTKAKTPKLKAKSTKETEAKKGAGKKVTPKKTEKPKA